MTRKRARVKFSKMLRKFFREKYGINLSLPESVKVVRYLEGRYDLGATTNRTLVRVWDLMTEYDAEWDYIYESSLAMELRNRYEEFLRAKN